MKILSDKEKNALKDLVIAIGGIIVGVIHANSPNPDHLAIILAASCIWIALYVHLTETK